MKKIIETKLISEKRPNIFENNVNWAISEGFQPYGEFTVKNVTFTEHIGASNQENCFILFMVKYED